MAKNTALRLKAAPELSGPPVDWAIDLLERELGHGIGRDDTAATGVDVAIDIDKEDVGLEGFSCRQAGRGLRIGATDVAGAAHAIVGLVDQLRLVGDLDAAINRLDRRTASAATPIRGIQRSFSSVDEDLPWFRSRAFWVEYLDWIAQARFNRFHLALGMQYNFGETAGASDNYLCFAYPYLLDVPGWDVRAEGVSDEERDTNLEMLRFIAAETKRRGMSFQLGLWNHAYDQRAFPHWPNPPHRFPITGLTPETHAEYCAAAVTELLRACPDIDGFTFRVHYEGGIPDQGHEHFWNVMFDALSASGRTLQVDMHAKGVDQSLLDAVDKPGLNAVLSAKYWAEHQGLPYHQASIRRREWATPVPPGEELMAVAEYSRRFTRYGYADFLNTDRRTDVMFRIWPGTQKLLLWGDPALAAGYGRLATFGGALGLDLCEPLFFKGRKGSGALGRRDPYIKDDLRLGLRDWTKYAYTYRIWGRKLYNPDAPRDEWWGYLRDTYGDLATSVEQALGPLSRILPLMTVAHGLGGSNNGYWPEIYTSLPVTEGVDPAHYGWDTEAPPTWGTVSPFDPTIFYGINEWARDALGGTTDGRYTPLEVAGWIEGIVEAARGHVASLRAIADPSPQLQRTAIDAVILSHLGSFFAARFRSAADYSLYQLTGSRPRLESALEHNRTARDNWIALVDTSEGVYQSNLRFGRGRGEHGSWADRLPGVEADVEAMTAELRTRQDALDPHDVDLNVAERPGDSGLRHEPLLGYVCGKPLELNATATPDVVGVKLHYRHVNQAETWKVEEMTAAHSGYSGAIPEEYTDSSYPLMYFFTAETKDGAATLHPGLGPELNDQPYYTVTADG